MPPVVAPNATLSRVAGGGFSEDYGTVEGSDTDRWTGSAAVRVHEKVEVVVLGDRADEVKSTQIVLPRTVGDLVQVGDALTYEWRGVTYTRKARDLRGNDISDTTRVWVDNA